MKNDTSKQFAAIPPYDITQGEHFEVYDTIAYVSDPEYCNSDLVKMESGNLYKYYRCAETKPIYVGDILPETEDEESESDTDTQADADTQAEADS